MRHPLINTGPYEIAFRLLLEDLDRVFQFIEPRDENAGVFSHRTYELLLRACTEFESVCKNLMVELSLANQGEQLNVRRYVELEDRLQLEQTIVGISRWQPEPRLVVPYHEWRARAAAVPKTVVLPWYAAHNNVKHNRRENFKDASLSNLMNAMGALFLLLVRASDCTLDGAITSMDNRGGFYYALGPFFSSTLPYLKDLHYDPKTGNWLP